MVLSGEDTFDHTMKLEEELKFDYNWTEVCPPPTLNPNPFSMVSFSEKDIHI